MLSGSDEDGVGDTLDDAGAGQAALSGPAGDGVEQRGQVLTDQILRWRRSLEGARWGRQSVVVHSAGIAGGLATSAQSTAAKTTRWCAPLRSTQSNAAGSSGRRSRRWRRTGSLVGASTLSGIVERWSRAVVAEERGWPSMGVSPEGSRRGEELVEEGAEAGGPERGRFCGHVVNKAGAGVLPDPFEAFGGRLSFYLLAPRQDWAGCAGVAEKSQIWQQKPSP